MKRRASCFHEMFLNALDSDLIILDPAVEFLSVENLPIQLLMLHVVRTC